MLLDTRTAYQRLILFSGLVFVLTIAASLAAIAYGRGKSDASLLTRQPCAAPCWYGITPGITTEAAARALLPTVRFYSAADDVTENRQGTVAWTTWYYTDSRLVNRLTVDHGVVSVIHVEPGLPFTLKDIVSIYGSPPGTEIKVVAGSETLRSTVSVSLYYPDDGLLVKFLVYDGPLKAGFDLSPDSTGISFEIYPHTASLEAMVARIQAVALAQATNYVSKHLRPWPGFDSVILPPHERNGPPPVTPSAHA